MQFALDSMLRGIRERPEEVLRSGRLLSAAQRASTQTVRLGALVEELLDVSRLSVSRMHLERGHTDLAAIARDVAARVADAAAAAGCSLDLDVPEPVTGYWDRVRLERVLLNLLANAIKYGAGSPIRVEVRGTRSQAFVSVIDRGIGIAPKDQARIFQRFERAVSTRNYGGFGLGLWIAREIVESHGGQIEVTSRPGEGATFRVTLERTNEVGADERAEPS
jgi:signal transduction histidine kinase